MFVRGMYLSGNSQYMEIETTTALIVTKYSGKYEMPQPAVSLISSTYVPLESRALRQVGAYVSRICIF